MQVLKAAGLFCTVGALGVAAGRAPSAGPISATGQPAFQADGRSPGGHFQRPSASGFALAGHVGGAVRAVAMGPAGLWMGEGLGVTLVDVANLSAPVVRAHGTVGMLADVHALATDADTLWVGATDGVHAMNAGSPSPDLIERSHLVTPGTVRGLTVHRGSLLIADAAYGLLVAEIADPSQPRVVAGLPLPGGAAGAAAVQGDLALVGGEALHVLEIPRIGAVVRLATLPTVAAVVGVALAETWGYVSVANGDLLTVDLTDPLAPRVAHRLTGLPSGPLALMKGDLFIMGLEMRRLDLEEPGAPTDPYGGPGPFGTLSGALSVAPVSGSGIAVARGDRVTLVDLPSADAPALRGEIESVWPIRSLAAVVGFAFAARGAGGLDILDLDPPEAAAPVLSYKPPGGVQGVATFNGKTLVSTGLGAQQLLTSDPAAPILGETFGPDWPQTAWLDAASDLAVAATVGALYIADWSVTPARETGRLEFGLLPDWPAAAVVQGVALMGEAAYLAAGAAGVAIIDLSDPVRPRFTRAVAMESDALSVDARENTLLLGLTDGLAILDISDPLSPGVVQILKLRIEVRHVVALPNGAILSGPQGLIELDLTDPVAPREVASVRPGYPFTAAARHPNGNLHYAVGPGVLVLRPAPVGTVSPTPADPTPPPVVPSPTASPAGGTNTASPSPTTTAEPTSTPGRSPALHLPWCGKPAR